MSRPGLRLAYDPRLVENAVMCRMHRHPDARLYHRDREALYDLPDEEVREAGFADLHERWFDRLRLGRPVDGALEDFPTVVAAVSRCIVAPASGRRDEGAELFVSSECGLRSIGIQLTPERFGDPDGVLGFLRHEFTHLSDILDAAFGYRKRLPLPEGGATVAGLIHERYRALWDASIDGRLTRKGWGAPGVRDRRALDFARAFPALGPYGEAAFDRAFDGPRPTHDDMVRASHDPGVLLGGKSDLQAQGKCALCGFPTRSFHPDPGSLAKEVRAAIRQDYPDWSPVDGLCVQCADLYASRPLSLRERALLPAVR